MTTGQFPKRRESERQASRRVERLEERHLALLAPIYVSADGRRRALNRAERRAARQA